MSYHPARLATQPWLVKQALGAHWQIEHIGSTSVPGLLADLVIDLTKAGPPQSTACSQEIASYMISRTS